MKKKLDTLTKVKLIYCFELWIISLIFLVLGILRLLKVIQPNDTFKVIFNIITIAGGIWIIIDFCWGFFSKKRRKKICLLDKILNLPLGIYLLVLDILCFCNVIQDDLRAIMIPIAFLYVAVDYIFQGFYHWKYPLPELVKEALEAEKEEQEKEKENEAK